MKKSTIILISVAGAILIIFLAFTIFLGFSIKGMMKSGDHQVSAYPIRSETVIKQEGFNAGKPEKRVTNSFQSKNG